MLQLLPLVASLFVLTPSTQSSLDSSTFKTAKRPSEQTSINLKVSKELKAFSDWMEK